MRIGALQAPWTLVFLACALSPCAASSTRPMTPAPAGSKAAPPPPADPAHFTFVLSGDNRAVARDVPMPPTAEQIFRELRLLQPAFTLWTGDCIYGSDDSLSETEAEYNSFLGLAALSATPLYNAPGNHEIYDRPEMAALYESRIGRLYGSFDYGNSHIIALDTEEIGAPGGIGDAQREWLEQDLEANKAVAHIFVYMHHPLFPLEAKEGWADEKNRDRVHALFVKYKVGYVFSGHEHLLYRTVKDGVNYWVTGGAGAPSDAAPEDGGYQHYILFQVDGDKVTASVLEPWRLFVAVGPTAADGSGSALASNYDNTDLPMCIEFPSSLPASSLVPSVNSAYKGKSHPLDAQIVPSRVPGVVTVRVMVPKHRSAFVTIKPKP